MKRIFTSLLLGGIIELASGANLIQNGSFELGTFCWQSLTNMGGNYLQNEKNEWNEKYARLQSVKDRNTLLDGKMVAALVCEKDTFNTIFTRPYHLPQGEYILSGVYCATLPPMLICHDKRVYLPAHGVWKKFSQEITVKEKDGAFVTVRFSAGGGRKGEVRLDNIRLERKGNTVPDFKVETGCFIKKDDAIFMNSESRSAKLQAHASKDAQGEVFYEILDFHGESVSSGTFKVDLKAGTVWEKEIPLPVKNNGLFHVITEFCKDGKRLSHQAEALFAVIPDRKLPTSPEDGWNSRFGCNMGTSPKLIEIARKMGVRWVMCAPPLFTKWMCTEPRPGEWVFHDDIVNGFNKAGLNLAGNLADSPWWATHPGHKAYGGPWPNNKRPTDMKQWDEYVRRVVTHYYPRIKVWVVGNEPDHPTFFGTDPKKEKWYDTFANLQKRTYQVAKSVKPDVLVGGGATCYCGTLCQILKYTDAIHYMDFGAFHFAAWTPEFYSRATTEERGQIARCYKMYKEKIGKEKGKEIPWWNTESHLTQADFEREYFTQPTAFGPEIKKVYTRMDAVNSVTRQYLGEWAIGIEKTFFWLLAPVSHNTYRRNESTVLEWDGAPTAAIPAYAAMTTILEGASLVSHERKEHKELQGRPSIWTYVFRHGDKKIRVLYTNRDEKVQQLIPTFKGAEVYDIFGNRQQNASEFSGMSVGNNVVLFLNRTPVYIIEPWQNSGIVNKK